jgi:hypothetical protein
MAASRKPPPLPVRKVAAGSWIIRSATMVSGKGISLAGGFISPIVKAGQNGIAGLSRDTESGMLVVERLKDGERQRIEIPLLAVALEMVWADG